MNDTKVVFIEEPTLQFGRNQAAVDPHDGLSFFGPFELQHPQSHHHAVIGTPSGIRDWKLWSKAMNQAHAVDEIEKFKLWPPFPSYSGAFGGRWSENPIAEFSLSAEVLSEASRKKNIHERCSAVVNEYLQHFQQIRKLDVRPSIVICVVPEEVHKNCRPESKVRNPSDKGNKGKSSTNDGLSLAPDFRRQLKALVMAFDMPIQIVRESTLRLSDENELGKRGLTKVSDRMWNICVRSDSLRAIELVE